MKTGLFAGALFFLGLGTIIAQPRLDVTCVGQRLQITCPTENGKSYELETSSDLTTWEKCGVTREGDGLPLTHDFGTPVEDRLFFRCVVTEATGEVAPTPAQMADLVVGTRWLGYDFNTATRFDWSGEQGDWTYEKTGAATGLLVLTYDEDDNDPMVYREEVVLTFSTSTSGTYRYSEFYGGLEYAGSVWTGAFDLAP